MERVSLNAEDFEKLVTGKIVKQGNVEIVLQDIGFDVIYKINENYVRILNRK
jgi:hypothetical protein